MTTSLDQTTHARDTTEETLFGIPLNVTNGCFVSSLLRTAKTLLQLLGAYLTGHSGTDSSDGVVLLWDMRTDSKHACTLLKLEKTTPASGRDVRCEWKSTYRCLLLERWQQIRGG